MCDEMESEFVNLIYHSDVRWLSRGKILTRVMSLRLEIHIFLTEKTTHWLINSMTNHGLLN